MKEVLYMLTAIVGINWGDEGKGRMVDLLSGQCEIVSRYQGGNNAGHTVVNERGKFILNLLPSGILRPETVNVMGPGMVIDIEHLTNEIRSLTEKGIEITPAHLKISDRATICMPYHKLLDVLEEDRLGDRKFGSTRRGIAPVYADKYLKKTFRMGDLLDFDYIRRNMADIVEWRNLTIANGYGHEPIDPDEMIAWLEKYGLPLADYVCDTTAYLTEAAKNGRDIMFEAQLGALRDIDFGIYPYTSSSSTIAAYAPIGAGVPGLRLDRVIGIMKAYSSCVGEGPFVCEFFGEEAERLRGAGSEYGAATGDIPVCTAYEVDGVLTDAFPSGDRLMRAMPVYESMPGWDEDISGCRTWEELPANARAYIEYVERAVGCPITYISVGAEREQYIKR